MEHISYSKVKIRKPRKCWGCAESFPVGSTLGRSVSKEDKIVASYWCDVCSAYMRKHKEDFDDGINFGDLKFEEHYQEFKNSLKQKG